MSDETVDILVNGRPVAVRAGASLAAALLGAGVTAFRASAGGEPRAPLCAMGVCYECRVTIDGVRHQRACMTAVRQGMRVVTAGALEPAE